MSSKKVLSYWYTGAAIAGAIVVAVAALLLAIIATARSIRCQCEAHSGDCRADRGKHQAYLEAGGYRLPLPASYCWVPGPSRSMPRR